MASQSDEANATTDELLATLANRQRRRVLQSLREQPGSVETDALAARLQSTTEDGLLHASLFHCHLPKLADADLITWDRDAGVVSTTDHPAYATPGFDRVLERDDDDWDAVLRALADARRRIALATLATHDGPLERRSLARLVAARGVDDVPTGPDTGRVDAVESTLHHEHLPKLADAALVSVDGEDVRFEGHPALDDAWVGLDAESAADETPTVAVVDADSAVRQLVELVE